MGEAKDFVPLGVELAKSPVFIGLLALAANESLYKNGFYDDRPDHPTPPHSILGGPVWITIGSPAPDTSDAAQMKRNAIQAFIMAAAIAQAGSGLIGQGIKLSSLPALLGGT